MNDKILWYATRGAGTVSLILLTAVIVLGVMGVSRFETRGWPRFLTTAFHRNLSLVAVVFLALHIVTAVVDPFTSLGWVPAVIPFGSSYRTLYLGLGTVAFELILAIVITSLARGLIGLGSWRLVHWLAYASFPVAVVHGWGTGTDQPAVWSLAITAVCVTAFAAATIHRLVRPSPDPLAADRAEFRSRATRQAGK